ncbi:MAG: recombination protein RecR [Candidatus Moranbacteria bacterium RIFOXYB1_FULL_44_23]|nr:MAG: recombination protein RecR [Candidatus Moranbacteria bacterium RIFOXYA1_FULL_44_8]OGI34975.1 MAG: recombination protein RecR [Candidatus Moranbacteria bacterium RIFOXYC1_FULL_44_8]OGI39537.1 MAG: recombination protein RecR [Candidatus Moranbacteria bacterium RIFOXYB1_FULL_44_23]OGI43218.1 MAG: recombination protein RecR [Candidatus Moranbacteria bacterium RIFOXYD1_FULL_44_9]
MMFPKSFQKLIDHFSSLPSIGPKLAERLVLYLWKQDKEKLVDFGERLMSLKNNIRFCKNCFNIAENEFCVICSDKKRDRSIICVVEEPLDIIALEKTRKFKGLYHVLGGSITAQNNKDLKISELKKRLKSGNLKEIIIATNPTTEGEATALYLARFIRPLNIKTTRLARGLPTGGDIEYADEATLTGAIEGRKEI